MVGSGLSKVTASSNPGLLWPSSRDSPINKSPPHLALSRAQVLPSTAMLKQKLMWPWRVRTSTTSMKHGNNHLPWGPLSVWLSVLVLELKWAIVDMITINEEASAAEVRLMPSTVKTGYIWPSSLMNFGYLVVFRSRDSEIRIPFSLCSWALKKSRPRRCRTTWSSESLFSCVRYRRWLQLYAKDNRLVPPVFPFASYSLSVYLG